MAEPAIEQQVRFCAAPGGRVAYAAVGSGPPLVLPAMWISHIELEWRFPEFRRFISALARGRTVIRYDRLGTGLSDRPGEAEVPSVDAEVETLKAVIGALDARTVSLLGISWGGCIGAAFAARNPRLVERVVLCGSYAEGSAIAPAPLREALVATVRAHWGAGSRLLTEIWLPGADASTRTRFAELQRAAARAELAAATLEAVYRTDVRGELAGVRAPVLVLHRRDDRAIPFALGRELAALLPDARLTALDGDVHPPWLGDWAAVVRALDDFLAPSRRRDVEDGDDVLSEREVEVLRLVAEGLTNEQIATRLIVSPHTVHRHVANIRLKLDQPSRAAAAAYATRQGLI